MVGQSLRQANQTPERARSERHTDRFCRNDSNACVAYQSTPSPGPGTPPCGAPSLQSLAYRCNQLEDIYVDEIDSALASRGAPRGADCAKQHRLLVSWAVITGQTERARRWTRLLEGDSTAALKHLQLMTASGRRPSVPIAVTDAQLNGAFGASAWLALHIDFYWRVIDGDIEGARAVLEPIRKHEGTSRPTVRALLTAMRAFCAAVDCCGDEVDLPVPVARPSLLDLTPVLIGAEATALGGSRRNALAWSSWFDLNWPPHVLRGGAWPVLAHRVRALLAARAGDLPSALTWIDRAIELADRLGSPVESALARVQAAEFIAGDPQAGSEARWSQTLQAGRDRSRALGIPHEHHALRARIAVARGRFDLMARDLPPVEDEPLLTPREIEVLRLFSAGHSYRQAADVLGVGWRTVQSHAYNAYQKLGVSSKIAAISAASRLQLI